MTNSYAIKRVIKFIGAVLATFLFVGVFIGVFSNPTKQTSTNESNKYSILKQNKTTTFSLSALCSTKGLGDNIQEFLDADVDCKKVLNIQSKKELSLFNNSFLRVSPMMPKLTRLTMKPTVPSVLNVDTTFQGVALYDDENNVINPNDYTINYTNIAKNSNNQYVVNRSSTTSEIELTLTNPIRVSKILFTNLVSDLNIELTTYTTKKAETIRRVAGTTTLDSSLLVSSINFGEDVKQGNELIFEHYVVNTSIADYTGYKIYDENDNLISSSDYTITNPSNNPKKRIIITFNSLVKLSRVEFENFDGRLTITTVFNKKIRQGEVELFNKNYIVKDSFVEKGIVNVDDFNNLKDEYKDLAKLKSLYLLDKDDNKVPYSLSAKEVYVNPESDEQCSTLTSCSNALQSETNTFKNGFSLSDVSYFRISSLDNIDKVVIIGDNIKADFSLASSNNGNFKGENNDWQKIEVTPREDEDTPNSISVMSNISSTIKALKCESTLIERYRWAMPKACDYLLQVLPYMNDDLTTIDPITNLTLKGNYLQDYPWWDIQKVTFDANTDSTLTLDFTNYTSQNTSFNDNFPYYLSSLFKRNAENLKKLVIKGPFLPTLVPEISKLTALEELVIDGGLVLDYTFLNSLTQLKKITIKNTQLNNVNNLLVGSTNIEEIDLSNNQITEVKDNAFTGLGKLTSLNLSNNQISEFQINALPSGTTLTTLDLSHNNLTSLPNLVTLTSLENLDISYNQLTSIPSGIVAIGSLRYLNGSNNQLTLTPASSSASQIEVLDIRNNPISIFPSDLKSIHPNLTSFSFGGATYELNVNANNTQYQDLVSFIDSIANQLETLRIENMNLLTETVEDLLTHLAQLTNLDLKTLSFADNQIGNFGNLNQDVPTTIEQLDLSNQNGLSIVPLFIEKLTNLKSVNLSDNSFISVQKINWPTSLESVDFSSNPLTLFSTLTNIQHANTIIAKGLNNLLIGKEDYLTLASNYNEPINFVVSPFTFNPEALYEARNPYDLLNVNIFIEEDSGKRSKVDLFDQFMILYESNSITSLRDQLRLDEFTTSNVINYIGNNQKAFYARAPIDLRSIEDENSFETYLDKNLGKLSSLARIFQLDKQKTEIEKELDKINNTDIFKNTNLIIAAVLVILVILANCGLAIFYFVRKSKKGKAFSSKK